jgi:hypothetical protein
MKKLENRNRGPGMKRYLPWASSEEIKVSGSGTKRGEISSSPGERDPLNLSRQRELSLLQPLLLDSSPERWFQANGGD